MPSSNFSPPNGLHVVSTEPKTQAFLLRITNKGQSQKGNFAKRDPYIGWQKKRVIASNSGHTQL